MKVSSIVVLQEMFSGFFVGLFLEERIRNQECQLQGGRELRF